MPELLYIDLAFCARELGYSLRDLYDTEGPRYELGRGRSPRKIVARLDTLADVLVELAPSMGPWTPCVHELVMRTNADPCPSEFAPSTRRDSLERSSWREAPIPSLAHWLSAP